MMNGATGTMFVGGDDKRAQMTPDTSFGPMVYLFNMRRGRGKAQTIVWALVIGFFFIGMSFSWFVFNYITNLFRF